MSTTTQIRKRIQHQRSQISPQYCHHGSQDIVHKLQNLALCRQAKVVACYMPQANEADLRILFDWCWRQGKVVALPCCPPDGSRVLTFKLFGPDTKLHLGRFGILEPNTQQQLTLCQRDVVLTPLVAFNRQGKRLGMGGGFYDTTFSNQNRPFLIGCGFDFQYVPEFTGNAWDIHLNYAITDKRVFCFNC